MSAINNGTLISTELTSYFKVYFPQYQKFIMWSSELQARLPLIFWSIYKYVLLETQLEHINFVKYFHQLILPSMKIFIIAW